MKKDEHIIVIPWDFTPVADYALQHGFKFAEKAKSKEIVLVHIIKNEKEHDSALEQLQRVASDNHGKNGVAIKALVRKGTIFTTIGEVASEVEAKLVIMGTHGLKGMQKLTGSWALKVIVSSKVPFVVVQEPPNESDLKDIIFPVDFKKENKEVLNLVNYLHKYFDPKFHIIKPNTTDTVFIKKIKANIAFSRKYMDGKGIDYEIHAAEGKRSFPVEIMEFGKNINADLLLIISTKNIGFTDYIIGAQEQYLIANSSKIPAMVVNPRGDLTAWEGYK
ncbi:MAG: universal stress protein [Bacteroidales bacterium]|jgi:nucleotide-binding universal stress UspA family protein|nr:universal stress protein [Bacteroidales bacterium]